MKKLAIALFAVAAIALPVFAAIANGAIDITGSKEADRQAILKSWAEAESKPAVKAAPKAEIVVAKTEEVKKAEAPRPVAKKAVAKRDTTVSCSQENLDSDATGKVRYCATNAFREETKGETSRVNFRTKFEDEPRRLAINYEVYEFTVGK